MLTLIIGSSASGKSLIAETIALNQQNGKLFYIATMENCDSESKERVKKHQIMRKDKGFETIEQPININNIKHLKDATYLLECMSNLVANEMYFKEGAKENAESKIISDIDKLNEQSDNLIVVTNEVFSDITLQDEFCLEYLKTLAYINCEIAKSADTVIESVAGIPIYCKGERYDYI